MDLEKIFCAKVNDIGECFGMSDCLIFAIRRYPSATLLVLRQIVIDGIPAGFIRNPDMALLFTLRIIIEGAQTQNNMRSVVPFGINLSAAVATEITLLAGR